MSAELEIKQQYATVRNCLTNLLSLCSDNEHKDPLCCNRPALLDTLGQELKRLYSAEQNVARKMVLEEVLHMISRNVFGDYNKKELRESMFPMHVSENTNVESSRRASVIESTIITPGKTKFSDVAGLTEAKKLLKEAVILPLKYPNLFVDGIKPWRRILLFGPPGTGKTKIAKALSSEVPSTFYSVSSSDLLSSWFGESEKLIKELFKNARGNKGRSIIFIDEIDSLCRKRNSNEEEQTRRIKTELLAQIEGLNSSKDDNLFILGATNCPWELDTAFLRRFEKRIYVPLPDKSARKELFKLCLGSTLHLSEDEIEKLLKNTEGYSGSDVSCCIADALFEPIRELEKSAFWKWNEDGKTVSPCSELEVGAIRIGFESIPPEHVRQRSACFKDMEFALKNYHCTVSSHELKYFETFLTCFEH